MMSGQKCMLLNNSKSIQEGGKKVSYSVLPCTNALLRVLRSSYTILHTNIPQVSGAVTARTRVALVATMRESRAMIKRAYVVAHLQAFVVNVA